MKNLAKNLQTHAGHGISQFELSKKVLNNLSQYNLKPTAKLVLLYLCDCYNPEHGEMFPKQSTIAQKLGVSEVSVIRAIQELHKEGLIISERKYINRYRFTSKIVYNCPQNEKSKKIVETYQKVKQPIKKLSPCIKQKKETNKSTNIEDFKILKEYAVSKGAKNINAYVNALIKSGSSQEILESWRKSKNNQIFMEKATKQTIKNVQFAKNNRVSEDIFAEYSKNIRAQLQ